LEKTPKLVETVSAGQLCLPYFALRDDSNVVTLLTTISTTLSDLKTIAESIKENLADVTYSDLLSKALKITTTVETGSVGITNFNPLEPLEVIGL